MKIYYGNSSCFIDGEPSLVSIRYKGLVEITDKTDKQYFIKVSDSKIFILPNSRTDVKLKDLFSYEGDFTIINCKAIVDGNTKSVIIKKLSNYSDFITSKSEDIDTLAQDLGDKGNRPKSITKSRLINPYISNHTKSHTQEKEDLYIDKNVKYEGDYNINIETLDIMTGSEITPDSKPLFYKNGKGIRSSFKESYEKSPFYKASKIRKSKTSLPSKRSTPRKIGK